MGHKTVHTLPSSYLSFEHCNYINCNSRPAIARLQSGHSTSQTCSKASKSFVGFFDRAAAFLRRSRPKFVSLCRKTSKWKQSWTICDKLFFRQKRYFVSERNKKTEEKFLCGRCFTFSHQLLNVWANLNYCR